MHDHSYGARTRGHAHDHASRNPESEKGMLFAIKIGICLNLTLALTHFFVFYFFSGKSIAVLGASLENLVHGIVLILSLALLSFSYTYGAKRLGAAAPIINALFLLGIGIYLILQGWDRIVRPQQVVGWIMMMVAGLDILSNIIQFQFMRKHFHNETIKSIVVHISTDSLASFGVIVGGFAVQQFDFYGADGIAAIGIGLISIILGCVFVYRSRWVFRP